MVWAVVLLLNLQCRLVSGALNLPRRISIGSTAVRPHRKHTLPIHVCNKEEQPPTRKTKEPSVHNQPFSRSTYTLRCLVTSSSTPIAPMIINNHFVPRKGQSPRVISSCSMKETHNTSWTTADSSEPPCANDHRCSALSVAVHPQIALKELWIATTGHWQASCANNDHCTATGC